MLKAAVSNDSIWEDDRALGFLCRNAVELVCQDVCEDFEAALKEFNAAADHVQLLVLYPPKVRLSEIVNSLKGVSSPRLKVEFPTIRPSRA
jgi:REP element-mobilizing transposase RayT